jgi:regulator of sigma E protease
MNVAVAIAGLAFLIIIHEAGHFFTALAVRMRPRRFYIFFPPALVKRTHNGIEYGVGMIPLGGYVKIPGMHKPAGKDLEGQLGGAIEEAPWLEHYVEPVRAGLEADRLADANKDLPDLRLAVERAEPSEPARKSAERALNDVEDALSPDAYWRAPVWKRVAVILAGPGTNFIFAVLLLSVVFMLGIPEDVTSKVAQVDGRLPAAQHLQAGDEIVAVNGRPVQPDQIAERIRASNGNQIVVTYVRDGERMTFTAKPELDEGVYRLGFSLTPVYVKRDPASALALSLQRTWDVTEAIGASLGRIVTGSGREEVSSPVGIVQASSQTLEDDYRQYLGVLALISLSLALLNLLPLLPLDGGHIAFSLAEGIRGKAIPREAYEKASAVGIILVLFLFFIGLSNDVDRLRGG